LKFEADPNYLPTLAHEYNITSMDGVGMMSVMQPDQSSAFSPNSGWDFSRPDDLVAFAQSNGMTVRGHNLIASASYNPDWFINGGWSPADLYQIMANRITTSISHFETNYPGVVQSWDVVNEGISDGCNSIWATMGSYGSPLGGDYQDPCLTYIFTAFQLARNAVNAVNPNIKLYYNEYGAEATWEDCSTGGSISKACKVYQLVRDLKNLGIIDGVGLQSHIWSLGDAPDYGALQHNIHQLGQLGLETQITEMDVGLDGPDVQDSEIQAQGPVYAGVAGACLAEPSCNAIVTWEFMDSISWLMAAAGRYAPLPFDANYNRKPAYYALQAALGGSGVASNNKSLGWNSVTGGKGTVFEIFQCGNSCTSLTANRVLQDDPGLMNYFQWYSDSFDQCWATIGAEGG
jgi:endo-1,4-beta-xylanase